MSHEVCKQAYSKLETIQTALENGDKLSMEDAVRYLFDRAICKDHRMKVFWKGYQREVHGAVYPEDKSMSHEYGPDNRRELSHMDAVAWMECMSHDGIAGPMWTEEQTTSVARVAGVPFKTVTPEQLCVAMNYVYQMFGKSLAKCNLNGEGWLNIAVEFVTCHKNMTAAEFLGEYWQHIAGHR